MKLSTSIIATDSVRPWRIELAIAAVNRCCRSRWLASPVNESLRASADSLARSSMFSTALDSSSQKAASICSFSRSKRSGMADPTMIAPQNAAVKPVMWNGSDSLPAIQLHSHSSRPLTTRPISPRVST